MNLVTLIKERLSAQQQAALEAEIRKAEPLTTAQRRELIRQRERLRDAGSERIAAERKRADAAEAAVENAREQLKAAELARNEAHRQRHRVTARAAAECAPIEHQLRESAAATVEAFGAELRKRLDRDRSSSQSMGTIGVEYDVTYEGKKIPKPESIAAVERHRKLVGDYLSAIVETYRGLDRMALTEPDVGQAIHEQRQRLDTMRQECGLGPWTGR